MCVYMNVYTDVSTCGFHVCKYGRVYGRTCMCMNMCMGMSHVYGCTCVHTRLQRHTLLFLFLQKQMLALYSAPSFSCWQAHSGDGFLQSGPEAVWCSSELPQGAHEQGEHRISYPNQNTLQLKRTLLVNVPGQQA